MRLARGQRQGAVIPMTPLVDVMLILLVFFMVTSTYLDLDMIPAAARDEEAGAGTAAGAQTGRTLLIRIAADGAAVLRGRSLAPAALEAAVRSEQEARGGAVRVLILPSGAATAQALVTVLDAVTRAGAAEARVLRTERAP